MKRISIKIGFLLPLLSLIFTSCLKDDDVDDGRIGIKVNKDQKIIEIAGPPSGFLNVDLVGSPKDTTVNLVVVRLASENPAENDLQVTLVPDASLVTAYNAAKGTNYQIPPANLYQIPSTLTVTIPKGQREAYATLKAIPNDLFGALYAFGFKIASTSDPSITISGNYSKQIVALTIRNKYDGIYELTSFMDLPADRSSAWLKNFTYPYDIHIVTNGPTTVSWINTAFGTTSGFHPLMTPSVSGFGQTKPVFEFDNNDKIVSVTNGEPPGSLGRSFTINPAVTTSRYDPATKTIYAAFIMTQTGFQPIPIYDTLRFIEPRP